MCAPLDKIKTDLDAKTHFAVLTPGQFHFAAGIYVGMPNTPMGMPPGDGALLLTHDGSKSGKILWTRGKNGCSPINIPEEFVRFINAVKTGAGEASDDSKDELKL